LARLVLEPMLGVTLTPTMARASEKDNVIPSRAYLKVDCRVPPGLGEDAARQRVSEVLGDTMDGLELEFTETVVGNESAAQTPLMQTISGWVQQSDPGAETLPVLLPGFSDSRWFRDAFPECVAYGFFPHRHMSLFEAAPLVHSANERIDVRDLGVAADFYTQTARQLLSR
jgi:acetylornithine deacetylase/succinyl-diaminopimelate desuccinylase-like protein